MPIYEYECSACHHQFDLMQKVTDPQIKTCPECLKQTVRRLVSAPQFQRKGTGWYVTDFKDKPKKGDGAEKPVKETPAAEKTTESAPTETKPKTSTAQKGDTGES